jgi:hypothetical protein
VARAASCTGQVLKSDDAKPGSDETKGWLDHS